MANSEQLAILAQGVEAWNAWRQANPDFIPDLTQAQLSGAELRSIDLRLAKLESANLMSADLASADLRNADLSGAAFHGANLQGANLNFAKLIATDFGDADLRGAGLAPADLEHADVSRANFFEGDPSHLEIFEAGPSAWSEWRAANKDVRPDLRGANFHKLNRGDIDLRQCDLRKVHFFECNFFEADFTGADLTDARLPGCALAETKLRGAVLQHADLRRAVLVHADLTQANLNAANLGKAWLHRATLVDADLRNADLFDANLSYANLSGADIRFARLSAADLGFANLSGANLREAQLEFARLFRSDLSRADLTGANLRLATLVSAELSGASLSGCWVHGVSAWNLDLTQVKDQSSLVITDEKEPAVTVDNLEVAQFIYLMLHNSKIRDVIDTITGKGVLILGRFTGERKVVLDAIRERLRTRNLVPMVFDWDKPSERDLTETVLLLANMSRFVVADVTDARSIPQELMTIVPNLPSVPVRPIIVAGQREYAMFEHFRPYPWVLPVYEYRDGAQLIDNIDEAILAPIESWEAGVREDGDLLRKLHDQDEEIRRLRAALNEALEQGAR